MYSVIFRHARLSSDARQDMNRKRYDFTKECWQQFFSLFFRFLVIQAHHNALLGSSWEAWRSYDLFCNSDASVEPYSFLWHESQIIAIIQRTSLLAYLSDYFLLLSFWCFWQTYLIGPDPFKWNMNKFSPRIMRLDGSNRKNILEVARRYPW